MGRFMFKGALVSGVTAAAAALTLSTAAFAAPAQNLSFAASNDGASAHWSHGKGSPIDLTLGSDSATTYALIRLHHLAPTAIATLDQPGFVTNNYSAGSPRYYITLSNGDTLWGYPPNSGLNGDEFAWAIDNGNTYQSWSAVQSAEASATVTGAYVIADGDQSPGTIDTITGLTFGANDYN